MAATSVSTVRRVVVVGGGFAGVSVTRELERRLGGGRGEYSVVMVDAKEYFENTSAVFASLQDPLSTPPESLQVPHASHLRSAEFVNGLVTSATSTSLVVSLFSGDLESPTAALSVPYDVLVVASGCAYNCQMTKDRGVPATVRAEWLLREAAEIEQAEGVVVVGAGPTGVELAANMASRPPAEDGTQREIVLIEQEERVLPGMGDKAGAYAEESLKRRGVRVVTGQRVRELETTNGRTLVRTESGVEFVADRVYTANGGKPNTDWLKENFGDALDEKGRVLVTKHLQVQGHPNIFAAGDVTCIPEEKLATCALSHAKVVAANVARMIRGKPFRKSLDPKSSKRSFMIISLGPGDALAVESGRVAGSGPKWAAAKRKMDLAAARFLPSQDVLPHPGKRESEAQEAPTQKTRKWRVSQKDMGCRVAIARFLPCSDLVTRICKGLSPVFVQLDLIVRDAEELGMAAQTVGPDIACKFFKLDSGTALLSALSANHCLFVPLTTVTEDLEAEVSSLASAIQTSHPKSVVVLCPRTCECPSHCGKCVGCRLKSAVSLLQFTALESGVKCGVLLTEGTFHNELTRCAVQSIQLHRIMLLPLQGDVSWLSEDDLVAAVCTAIVDPDSVAEKVIKLTGPFVMTGSYMASVLSGLVGDTVEFVQQESELALLRLAAEGMCEAQAELLVAHACTANVPNDALIQLLSGCQPESFEHWAMSRGSLFLSERSKPDLDLSRVLRDPAGVRDLLNDAVQRGRIVHVEISKEELGEMTKLTEGANAEIFQATFAGSPVSVKIFKDALAACDPKDFRDCVALLSVLRHPSLVRIIGAGTIPGSPTMLVSEHMERGSLERLIKEYGGPFPASLQLRFALDLARGLRFLHELGMVAGDIKPSNVLVTGSMQVKLTGIGTARLLGSDRLHNLPDNLPYVAPEALANRDSPSTEKTDAFGYAVTLWVIATQKKPYDGVDQATIVKSVVKGDRPTPPLPSSHALRKVVEHCWHGTPAKRPSFVEVYDQLLSKTSSPVDQLLQKNTSLSSLITRLFGSN